MSKRSKPSAKQPSAATARRSPVLNYSLRPAKNIERKMMGEAFARLAPLCPLASYRYIGFGSEFFNDFALYHETLGIRDMVSIEHHLDRVPRCEFNRPYKCIKVVPGTASEYFQSRMKWEPRSIIWLDYLDKLERSVLEDLRLVVSRASSGSLVVWTVNAHPWGDTATGEDPKKIAASDLPRFREQKLRDSLRPTVVPDEWLKSSLAKWGLATLYYQLIREEIDRVLADRNASAMPTDQVKFYQCFHFRYKDGQRMLTVGGVILNDADAGVLGPDPFAGLFFIRKSGDPIEIRPPVLTGREARHLSRLFPHDRRRTRTLKWLSSEEIENFREVYRYYPVFAESEL